MYLLQKSKNIDMVLCAAKLLSHVQKTLHHGYVWVIGRGKSYSQMLVDFLNALHQNLDELFIS